MTALSWAIVFATIEICAVVDERIGQKRAPGFRGVMAVVSLFALGMLVACTIREWR